MDKPIVKIKEEAWDKLWQYIMAVQGEISGFGHAYINSERNIESTDHSIIIEDIFIVEQESGGAHTKLKEEAIHKYLADEMRLAVKEERRARKLNLWWHSHGRMGTFWSGTDTGTMDSFSNSDWKIHIVGNREQSYLCRVIAYKPIRHDWDDVKLVPIKENQEIVVPDEIKNEVKEKVKEYSFSSGRTGFLRDKFNEISRTGRELLGWGSGRDWSVDRDYSIFDNDKFSEGDKVKIKVEGGTERGIITKEHFGFPKKYDIFVKGKNETHMEVSKSDIMLDDDPDDFSWVADEEELKSMVAELDHLMDNEEYSDASEVADEIMKMNSAWGEAHGVDEVVQILKEIPSNGKSKKGVKKSLEKASENMRAKLLKDEEKKEEKDGIDKN